MNPKPPKWGIRFLEWYCPSQLYESIEGDLLESYESDIQVHGIKKAKRIFTWNVLRFFRPGILLRNRRTIQLTSVIMFENYLKVAFRSLQKRKFYSFINAFGLSIGIAFCLLIYLFIQDERSFDQFHANKNQLFRIEKKSYDTWQRDPNQPYKRSAYIQSTLQPVLKNEFPQVVWATRLNAGQQAIMTVGDKIFTEKITFVDADFFKMFSFPLIEGSATKIFSSPSEIVLTRKIAKKYFGDESPLDKTIRLDIEGEKEFTVTGLIDSPPYNSSIDFSILVPQQNRPYFDQNNENWGSSNTITFAQLLPNTGTASFKANLDQIVSTYMSDRIEEWRTEAGIDEQVNMFEYTFTALPDVHLNKDIPGHKVSDPKFSFILGGIALLILTIASINYVSLALTSSASRRMEVGIRKASGAQKNQILYQFSFESIITAGISAILGLVLVLVFLPVFNALTLKQLAIVDLWDFKFILTGIALVILVGITAGGYPALFLSRFNPASVLKGTMSSKFKAGFTKPLVVIQFFLSACLIISSIVMFQQMRFISTKELGFNKDQLLVLPSQMGWNRASNDAVAAYRSRLAQEPDVISIAGTSSSFSQGWSRYGFTVSGQQKSAYVYAVDPHYIPTLKIELVTGRNFDPARASDSLGIIVNEALVKDMGWDNPTEEFLNWREDSVGLGAPVIGVMKDYHFLSLEEDIGPLLLSLSTEDVGYLTNMLVKINSDDIPYTVSMLERTWKELYPNKPFDYSFLDQDVASQYAAHNRWMKIMSVATGLAILIACLGLFGLSGINTLNRTKEIGIRKIMGAELGNIFYLLNREFILYALLAFILAVPAAWYAMDKWLESFKFRIEIGWELFAISILVGLAVALLTVSYHGIKASLINPADTLKYE